MASMTGIAKAPALPVVLLLLGFVALWTLYATLTQVNLDGFGDMLENYSWGIAWQQGYFKHPPFFAWVTAAWFSVLPRADWAYYLLSATNAGLLLVAGWRIALRYLDPWRAFLSAALFFFLPPVTFLALKYNANAAMLPLWAATALFYIRLLEKRRLSDAVALGALAAAAMLTKYYSAVLLGAIVLQMLLDPAARRLFAGAGAWVAGLVFLALAAPHVLWLFDNAFLPLTYAAHQGNGSPLAGIVSAPRFLAALLAYALPAGLVLAIAVLRNGRGAWFETRQLASLAQTLTGRALLWVSFGSLGLTLALGMIFSARFSSVWALPLYFPVPILLVMCIRPGRLEDRRSVVPLAVAVYAAALLALSPLILRAQRNQASNYGNVPVQAIAEAIERAWNARMDGPLAYVAGDKILAAGTTFYARSRPYSMQQSSFALTPWVSREDVARGGIAIACFAGQAACIESVGRFAAPAPEAETLFVPGLRPGTSWTVRLFLVAPRRG